MTTDEFAPLVAEISKLADDQMVVKWIVVAETISAEGSPSLWTLVQKGQSVWTLLGLIEHVKHKLTKNIPALFG